MSTISRVGSRCRAFRHTCPPTSDRTNCERHRDWDWPCMRRSTEWRCSHRSNVALSTCSRTSRLCLVACALHPAAQRTIRETRFTFSATLQRHMQGDSAHCPGIPEVKLQYSASTHISEGSADAFCHREPRDHMLCKSRIVTLERSERRSLLRPVRALIE